MSAALKRLLALGYVSHHKNPSDARKVEVRLTRAGARAMSESSVLEASRVRTLLKRLDASELERALDGLGLLARAAREMKKERES